MINLPTRDDAKAIAKRLRHALAERGADPGHSGALELVARAYGLADWNTMAATAPGADPAPAQTVVPVLRIFDWPAAQRFYLDYLGWHVDWQHRFEDHLPLYVQISGPDGARLHLSEHHGDGTPGSAVLIEVTDVEQLHATLSAKDYNYARPGIEDEDWGRCVTVYDPFSNRITFMEHTPAPARVPDELPPITTTVRVALDPAAAFELFTSFSWWRQYGLDPGGRVVIEEGTVIFRNPGGDKPIGTVTAWHPGASYAQTFTLAQDPDHPTTLEARFTGDGDSTVVEVAHGGWDATNAERRGHFTDWPTILAGYVATADALPSP